VAGADFAGVSKTDFPACFVAQTESVIEVAAKIAANTQVIFARVETAPRGPNAAWLTPPKAALISTFSPPWIMTERTSKMHTKMWNTSKAVTISPLLFDSLGLLLPAPVLHTPRASLCPEPQAGLAALVVDDSGE
jgi:hypothetical protein